jgi:hypothetical protein
LAEAPRFARFFLTFLPSGLCGCGGVDRKCLTTFWNSGSFVGSVFIVMVALPADPLYSAKLRIKRAAEHLDNLIADFDRFFAENPGGYITEPDPNGTHEIHKIKFTKRFPIEWRILATEIIEHLRASLDHATFAAFFLATGRLDSNYAAFPFGKTPSDLDNSVRGRSKDLRPEIQTLLRGFNAYKGGNDLLYTLNDLANDCKHGLIAFIGGAVADYEINADLTMSGIGNDPVEIADPVIWDGEKNEIVYARVRKGTNFDHHGKLRVYVALSEMGTSANVSASTLLDDIGREVARVVDEIEGECRRISILR